MDKFWQAVNGTKTLLALLAIIVAGALWASDLKSEVQRLDRYGTTAAERRFESQERRLQRIERNLIRLGAKWNVEMEEPPRR